jgi:hypothetical protein
MGLMERLDSWMWRRPAPAAQRYDLQAWVNDLMMAFGGNAYGLHGGTLQDDVEKVGSGFESFVRGAYQGNGVVFACELARLMLFTEARFQWRKMTNGRPGQLFGTTDLRPLNDPWPGGTTGDLLARMILDADFAGNSFIRLQGSELARLRPDWVSLVYDGDPWEPETRLQGYLYQPGGPGGGNPVRPFPVEEIAHFAPLPDPLSPRRGMSWLTPVLREIDADAAATAHKDSMFRQGGTPNMIVKADATVTKELFDAVVKMYREGHEDAANAGKAWFVQSGFDPDVIGSSLRQSDFKAVQGAGETRICMAAGVPPVIVGSSEGLQAATYSNYGQARRRFADLTMRPLWRNVAGSLEWIINTPQVTAGRAELWYDERDISFLQEDAKDAAEIQGLHTAQITSLVKEGFPPDAAVDAVMSGDLSLLKGEHTGLVSVQLQLPGTELPPTNGGTPPNGKAPAGAAIPA